MSIDGRVGDAAAVSTNRIESCCASAKEGRSAHARKSPISAAPISVSACSSGQVRAEQCVQCEHTIDVEMIVDDELGLDVIGIGDVSQADLGGAVGLVARIRLVRYPMAELDVAVTANAARICTVGEDHTVRRRARMLGADDVEAIGHGGGHAVRLRPQPHSRSTARPGQPVVCAYRCRRGVPLRRMRLHLRLDVRAGHVRRVCRASRRPRRVARGRTGGRRAPEASTRGVVCARIRMSRPGCAARAARPGAVGPPGGRSGAPADGSGRTSLARRLRRAAPGRRRSPARRRGLALRAAISIGSTERRGNAASSTAIRRRLGAAPSSGWPYTPSTSCATTCRMPERRQPVSRESTHG